MDLNTVRDITTITVEKIVRRARCARLVYLVPAIHVCSVERFCHNTLGVTPQPKKLGHGQPPGAGLVRSARIGGRPGTGGGHRGVLWPRAHDGQRGLSTLAFSSVGAAVWVHSTSQSRSTGPSTSGKACSWPSREECAQNTHNATRPDRRRPPHPIEAVMPRHRPPAVTHPGTMGSGHRMAHGEAGDVQHAYRPRRAPGPDVPLRGRQTGRPGSAAIHGPDRKAEKLRAGVGRNSLRGRRGTCVVLVRTPHLDVGRTGTAPDDRQGDRRAAHTLSRRPDTGRVPSRHQVRTPPRPAVHGATPHTAVRGWSGKHSDSCSAPMTHWSAVLSFLLPWRDWQCSVPLETDAPAALSVQVLCVTAWLLKR